VKLTVWGFALPDTIAMRSNFGSLGGRVAKRLGMDASSAEFQRIEDLYIDTMLAHRCIPSSLGNIWPKWSEEDGIDDSESGERLRMMVEDKHVNSLRLPFSYRSEPEKCKKYLHDLAAYLREKGWLDLAYIYMRDEPNNAEQYETVRQQGALIHEADPGIKRLCTEQTITSNPDWGDLYGAVDIWCPLFSLFKPESAAKRQALGETIWTYTALCQGRPTPWWHIDYPLLNYRVPAWMAWRDGIRGLLYWGGMSYWNRVEDPWTEAPYYSGSGRPQQGKKGIIFQGEGSLVYPARAVGYDGIVPTIRLKALRDALEDYEYLALLERKGKAEEARALVRRLTPSWFEWNRDPRAYEVARQQLASLLVEE
jgi:hypothetical protein